MPGYRSDELELGVNCMLTSSLGSKGKVEISDRNVNGSSCEIPDVAKVFCALVLSHMPVSVFLSVC